MDVNFWDRYWGVIHQSDDGTFGIAFPDVRGCVSSSSTLTGVCREGHKALTANLKTLAECGLPIPRARSLEELENDPEFQEFAAWSMFYVEFPLNDYGIEGLKKWDEKLKKMDGLS